MRNFIRTTVAFLLVSSLFSCMSPTFNSNARAEMISELHGLLAQEGAIAVVPMVGHGVTPDEITASAEFAVARLQEAYPEKESIITDPQYVGGDSVLKPNQFLRDVDSDIDVSVFFYLHERLGSSSTGRTQREMKVFIFNSRSSRFVPADLNFGGNVKYTIAQSGGVFSRWRNEFAALVHEMSTDTTLTINERAYYDW